MYASRRNNRNLYGSVRGQPFSAEVKKEEKTQPEKEEKPVRYYQKKVSPKN